MKRLMIRFALALTLALPLVAQQADRNYTGKADIQKTPGQQLAYARKLYSTAITQQGPVARQEAFVNAITALEAVPYKWPNDKAAVGAALMTEGQYFFGEAAYPNVLKVLDRAADIVTGTSEEGWMWDLRGRALERLNRLDDAEKAYEQAKKHAVRLDAGRQSAILRDAALLHTHRGRFAEASDEYREVARLRGARAWSALTPMMMSLEANLHGGDKTRAREDLDRLDKLVQKAHGESLAPADRQGLAEAEETLKHYRKKIG
jgi:tetratricopeptide (TPR) repeat protein